MTGLLFTMLSVSLLGPDATVALVVGLALCGLLVLILEAFP